MAFDGVFIHHLLAEMMPHLAGARINRLYRIDDGQFLFILASRQSLYVDVSPSFPHFCFTRLSFAPAEKATPFSSRLKKIGEGAIIRAVTQEGNDRVVRLDLDSFDDMHYKHPCHLILEFFGRNANAIITDEENIIIDCAYRTDLLGEAKRRLVPGIPFTPFPVSGVNPFTATSFSEDQDYCGCAKELHVEMIVRQALLVTTPTDPLLIKVPHPSSPAGVKSVFYCFDLPSLQGEREHFPSLSALLDHVLAAKGARETMNREQKLIASWIAREESRLARKLSKQLEDQAQAVNDRHLKEDGLYLLSHLSQVKRGDAKLMRTRDDGTTDVIPLEPLLDPTQNLERIFNRYKKAKRAEEWLQKEIAATRADQDYVAALREQLAISGRQDALEMIDELGIAKKNAAPKRKRRPEITTYRFGDALILVGKNNVQNNYLTKEVAHKEDWFFHVKGIPGSHVILKTARLTPELIQSAADIASFHSSSRDNAKVPVDYTQVRYVKRVPGTKGSFVTFTHEETVDGHPEKAKSLKQVDSLGR